MPRNRGSQAKRDRETAERAQRLIERQRMQRASKVRETNEQPFQKPEAVRNEFRHHNDSIKW
jgi:hypothetical protein